VKRCLKESYQVCPPWNIVFLHVDRPRQIRQPPDPSQKVVSILQFHPDLTDITGTAPSYSLLLSSLETSKNPFFHEACIYLPEHEELYITSHLLQSTSLAQLPVILISKLFQLKRDASGDIESVTWQKLRPPPNMPMPAGGTRYRDGMLFCSQGSLSPGSGGLYYMPRGKPPEPVLTNFFGQDFNSVHDVVLAKDGALWFTDAWHGFEQEFRPKPELPCHIYRFVPESGEIRVMAESLGRPHAIAFSPDEDTLYVTEYDSARDKEDAVKIR
jgi:gluconolactonase